MPNTIVGSCQIHNYYPGFISNLEAFLNLTREFEYLLYCQATLSKACLLCWWLGFDDGVAASKNQFLQNFIGNT